MKALKQMLVALVGVVMASLLSVILLTILLHFGHTTNTITTIKNYRWGSFGLRLIAYVVLISLWPRLSRWLVQKNKRHLSEIKRWHLFLFFSLFEILIIQQGLAYLVSLFW